MKRARDPKETITRAGARMAPVVREKGSSGTLSITTVIVLSSFTCGERCGFSVLALGFVV